MGGRGCHKRKNSPERNVDENKTEILEQLSAELSKVTMSLDIFFVSLEKSFSAPLEPLRIESTTLYLPE